MTSEITGNPGTLAEGLRAGNLEVRLARSEKEIEASQKLRYRVFYDEMQAHPNPQMARERRDFDSFDPLCDHLLVVDHSNLRAGEPKVVGTYRLIRRAAAKRHGGFYTAGEYDISKVEALKGEILELGRSCVDKNHRNRPTMQLMWGGILAYVRDHDIVIMFGCASLHGTDVDAVADELSYLYAYHLAPPAFRPRALEGLYVPMERVPMENINAKRALAAMPPLIKGYLRIGGFVGDGAVVDEQFNTTDVCILVKTDLLTGKYIRHFERSSREQGGA